MWRSKKDAHYKVKQERMKQIGKIEKLLNDFDSALLHCNGRLFNNANNNKKNKNQQTRETHTKKERNDGRVLRKLFVKE